MKTFFAFASLLLLLACQHNAAMNNNPGGGPPPDPTTLAGIQANIFTPKCSNQGCHPGGGAPMSLRTGESYAALVNVISPTYGLPRVSPGNPNGSVLYLKVLNPPGLPGRMPAGGNPLPQTDLDNIAAWINKGAPQDSM